MTHPLDLLPVPATYTRVLLQRLAGAEERLLSGTGLAAATQPFPSEITVVQQLQVFRNAMSIAHRADWALEFGRLLNISSHGPLGFAALSALCTDTGALLEFPGSRNRRSVDHGVAAGHLPAGRSGNSAD